MIACNQCHYNNPDSAATCQRCGASLVNVGLLRRTRSLYVPNTTSRLVIRDKHVGKLDHNEIALYLADREDPLITTVTQETVLGRVSRVASIMAQPSFDLTPFQAVERGVSRTHAALRRYEDSLTLLDLESTNGTWINNTRLLPNVPTPLNNGDRVVLAKLPMYIFF